MPESIVDGFDAIGKMAEDDIWNSRLHKKVAEVLSGHDGPKEPLLAGIYLEAEKDLLRKKPDLRPEELRKQLKPVFDRANKDYPRFNLLFALREQQFMAMAGFMIAAYAERCRAFIAPAVSERVIRRSFEETPWSSYQVTIKGGIPHDAMKLRTMQECVEMVSVLFETWYEANLTVLGKQPNQLAFEQAFKSVAKTFAFLPATQNLLGATPLDVLSLEKAKRLHDLETETSSQAMSIRAADEGLRRQAERLQNTVRELEETRQKLEVTSQARSAFIDVVSHQFRTPLSSIRWNAELLSDELGSKPGVEAPLKEAFENIRTKSVYLIETLDRVFTTLDIDTGEMVLDLKPAFLWEIIQDVYGNYERDIKRRGLKWKFNRDKDQVMQIQLDKTKITSVLKIIIGNAINYNKDGGRITVDLGFTRVNGNDYQVCSVADEGIGMSEADQAGFFDKFFRSQAAILKVADGTGLGTYIVQHILEAHKGFARAESPGSGKGTKVTIGLPVILSKP